MKVIQSLYNAASELKSRANMLVNAWILALLLSLIVPFTMFAAAARTARSVALGQASPAELAIAVVNAIIVSITISLLTALIVYYVMVRLMESGVKYSQKLAWARLLIREGPDVNVEEAMRRARPADEVESSYNGYYTIFKITVGISLLTVVALTVLRSRLVESVESTAAKSLGPSGTLELWEAVSPIASLMIIVGIIGLVLAFARILYGKSFFDSLNRDIHSYRSTGLYYALLEIMTLITEFVKDLIVAVLALGALVFFLMDVKRLSEDAERYIGTVRAELRKTFGSNI